MEDAFRFALLTLYDANEAICRDDPRGGRHRQHTVLQVPWVLSVAAFREKLGRTPGSYRAPRSPSDGQLGQRAVPDRGN